MLGAAQALGESVSSAHDDTANFAGLAAEIRTHLDAERFAAAWAEGHALTFDQAVAEALALAVPAAPETGAAPTDQASAEPLTRREWEIARLLARGESNRQIADALFVSVGTVTVHVHHILQKLDLRSRWQIADWVAAQDAPHHDLP
jgi:non-specific serine/threonine protein kinase